MSVATMHFDPVFSMGGRSNFNWPTMESSGGLFGSEMPTYGSESSMTPPSTSRSVTASPPRTVLSTESREVKRQMDQYRREHKMANRVRRADSGASSIGSMSSMTSLGQLSPPRSLRDLAPSASMPMFSAASTQLSLSSEASTTLAPAPYMSTVYSPPLDNQAMFSHAPYQQPYLPDYSATYPTQSTTTNASNPPALPSHYHRGSMTTEPPMLYPMPAAPLSMPHQPMPNQHAHSHPVPQAHHAHIPHHDGVNSGVRVVQSRPKPQCWEHGCAGRQFSTFSNLLRHQREKSGHATKSTCPNCGAEFTRTTARNGHLQHDKCKQRKNSE